MRLRLVAMWFSVLLFSLAAAQGAHAQVNPPPDSAEGRARESFQRGRIHYENGEFEAAALAFEEAYSLSGRDALLYNLYLAYRDANQQEKAAEALRNYLARVQVIENRAQLEARLKALDEGIAAKKAEDARRAEEAQKAEPSGPASAPTPVEGAETAESNGKWWLVPTLVAGAGGVLMAASIPTGLMVKSKQKKLDDGCSDGVCDPSLKSTADSGKTLSYVTDALLIGGAAVAATGVVLLILKRPKPAADQPQVGIACLPGRCAGSVSYRF